MARLDVGATSGIADAFGEPTRRGTRVEFTATHECRTSIRGVIAESAWDACVLADCRADKDGPSPDKAALV